jgi:hypothetical protein
MCVNLFALPSMSAHRPENDEIWRPCRDPTSTFEFTSVFSKTQRYALTSSLDDSRRRLDLEVEVVVREPVKCEVDRMLYMKDNKDGDKNARDDIICTPAADHAFQWFIYVNRRNDDKSNHKDVDKSRHYRRKVKRHHRQK